MGEDPRDGREQGISEFKHPLRVIKGCAELVTFYGLLPLKLNLILIRLPKVKRTF